MCRFTLAGIGTAAFITLASQPTLAAPAITLKASFNYTNGYLPTTELTPAGNGLFYGTTSGGGYGNAGTIFEFDPSSGGISVKASFNSANGKQPEASLTPAGNGKFYGTTIFGGSTNNGSLFQFDPSSGGIALIFSLPPGYIVQAALTPAGNGLFYGTAFGGGCGGYGCVFKFDPSIGYLYPFYFNRFDGSTPGAALTLASNGKFYGTTLYGGANNVGSIFEFDPSNGVITGKASFNGANGRNPYAELTPDGNGKFYGTTLYGGANNVGSIFEFDPTSGGISIRASFAGANGAQPKAALTPAGNGKFYGTTSYGGANNQGSIFEFDPSVGDIALMASFDGASGANPTAALVQAGNGLFYGTANNGGANGAGSIFEFDPTSGTSLPGVPGPLPLMGVTAAFGWSRKIRRHIQLLKSTARNRTLDAYLDCEKSGLEPGGL